MAKDSSNEWSSALAGGADTIVARATPAGRGALAVLRVSGSRTEALAADLCPKLDMNRPWHAQLVELVGRDGVVVDTAVAIPYRAPRSATGEDMLEVIVHGSPWIVAETTAVLRHAGARDAEPGEFLRRAVANGKIDLVQAEAINDLTRAETTAQARAARVQASGVLSERFRALRDDLTSLLARIEASLDFAAQEIAYDRPAVAEEARRLLSVIDELAATAAVGRRLRDGIRVAIVGPRNSGKSTLFNRLVGSERAIVSPHPGTTRDLVEAELEIAGIRVVLQDTAGIGDAADPIEAEGMRRTAGAAAEADALIVLWPVDGDGPPEEITADEEQTVLRVRSKSDLAEKAQPPAGWLSVSCVSGRGERELRSRLRRVVGEEVDDLGGIVAICERHRRRLEAARTELAGLPAAAPELAAEAVRAAVEEMRELLGEVAVDDVLDRVFADFCIGK